MGFKLGDFESAQEVFGRPKPCGKFPHATPELALIHLQSLLQKDTVLRPELLNIYRCPFCKAWHVGRQK